jgi:predicted GH43/DUF377 family glycosyl hydrolase
MVKVIKEGVILKKTDLEFENEGVLNPAVFQEGNKVHILYRAVRKGNFSTIGYAQLAGPLKVIQRNTEPFIIDTKPEECHGIEDPRIVKIDSTYYLTYTAYDGKNALGALATSNDFSFFEKKGIISAQMEISDFKELMSDQPAVFNRHKTFFTENALKEPNNEDHLLWDKNLILFPKKINNQFLLLHRVKPDIQLTTFSDFSDLEEEFWKNHLKNISKKTFLTSKYKHEDAYVGGGCPPIETKEGWLIIYHGVTRNEQGNIYNACAALFSLTHPFQELARLPYPLFSPEKSWEKTGYVNNVVFPTGTAIFDDRLYIYYGAADDSIAVASVNLEELIQELLKHKISS